MTIKPIIIVPDPVLKQVAQPVSKVDANLQRQLDDMLETMYDAPGIGLAANQVGMLNRVFVMDLNSGEDDTSKRTPICMVNPEIIWRSEEPSVWEEGCLSIPGQFAEVERPKIVRVKYVDYHGVQQEGEFSDLASHCVQHELDHLNGVLFVDYLSRLKRNMILRKVQKDQKNAVL
ncbi:MAG: peptide deformylase [Pseudobdellovibrionaceae bacterium]